MKDMQNSLLSPNVVCKTQHKSRAKKPFYSYLYINIRKFQDKLKRLLYKLQITFISYPGNGVNKPLLWMAAYKSCSGIVLEKFPL